MRRVANISIALTVLCSVVLAPLAFTFGAEDNFWQGYLFETALTASEEVHDATPAVATGHSGAWFAGNGVAFNYWLSVFSEEPILGAHYHCAPRGQNGPVVVHLDNKSFGTTTAPTYGEIGRAYLTNADIEPTAAGCEETIGYAITNLADLARAMLEGNIYTNIHTPSYPAGAARGQMTLYSVPDSSLGLRDRPERPERPERPARPPR